MLEDKNWLPYLNIPKIVKNECEVVYVDVLKELICVSNVKFYCATVNPYTHNYCSIFDKSTLF